MALRLDEGRQWTYEDYRALPEDGKHYEVLDGKLYVTLAPSPYHQTLSVRLLVLFYPLQVQGRGQIFHAPVDVLMPGATPVQPDLVFLTAEQAPLVTSRAIEGAPHLVVEILSRSTAGRDRTIKLSKYASCGVEHYWMLDPFARTLELYHLADGIYRLEVTLAEGDRHECVSFPDLAIDMTALFDGIPEVD